MDRWGVFVKEAHYGASTFATVFDATFTVWSIPLQSHRTYKVFINPNNDYRSSIYQKNGREWDVLISGTKEQVNEKLESILGQTGYRWEAREFMFFVAGWVDGEGRKKTMSDQSDTI